MTNIDRWPEAFENGIPKVGGRWKSWREVTIARVVGGFVTFTLDTTQDVEALQLSPGWTFLGFPDSAPVNQGAAAPQAAPVVKPIPCMMSKTRGECRVPSAWRWTGRNGDSRIYFFCEPCHGNADTNPSYMDLWTMVRISALPAPLVAPSPSLKAAVQQEGLAILPQTGTRHEVFEAAAQKWEGAKQFNLAGQNMKQARAALDADLAYDAEADAIRENRIVRKAALQEMGRGDRECFKLRNLREFEAIKSAEHAMYFWWKS